MRHDDPPAGTEPTRQSGAWPSEDPIELVASWSRTYQPLGSVEGRLLDSAGRLSANTEPHIVLESEGPSWSARAKVDGGRFLFEHIAPGRHRVRVTSADDPVGTWDWFDLAPGEERDLGTLQTEPGGSLVVNFERTEDAQDARFVLYVIGPSPDGANRYFPAKREIEPEASTATIAGLSPGEYRLRVAGEGLVYRSSSVHVRANEEAEATKAVERGVLVAFDVHNPEQLAWGELNIDLVEDGTPFEEWSFASDGVVLPYTVRATLPVGGFVVNIRTDSGLSASRSFEVGSMGAPESQVRLELKRP